MLTCRLSCRTHRRFAGTYLITTSRSSGLIPTWPSHGQARGDRGTGKHACHRDIRQRHGFPPGKANCYEFGVHVPLAIMWPERVKESRIDRSGVIRRPDSNHPRSSWCVHPALVRRHLHPAAKARCRCSLRVNRGGLSLHEPMFTADGNGTPHRATILDLPAALPPFGSISLHSKLSA